MRMPSGKCHAEFAHYMDAKQLLESTSECPQKTHILPLTSLPAVPSCTVKDMFFLSLAFLFAVECITNQDLVTHGGPTSFGKNMRLFPTAQLGCTPYVVDGFGVPG